MSRNLYQTPRWRNLRLELLDEAGWRCQECGACRRFEIDHVVPWSRGGDFWDRSNLRVLCKGCHFSKTGKENAQKVPQEVEEWRNYLAAF